MTDNTIGGIYIALGANLANKRESFVKALQAVEAAGAKIINVSGLWQSPSWPPGQGHPDYLNACAQIHYDGCPQSLLDLLHKIEADRGRARSVRNAPRPLDLDILDFKGQRLATDTLTLPHPRLHLRGFVLFPLEQIAPNWTHPDTAETIHAYIARLTLSDVAPMTYRGSFWP